MKYVISLVFIFFIVSSALFSCKKEKPEETDLGYSYFPEQVGSFVVYDVDSLFYNDFTNRVDTFKFQLKEKIQSVFLDNENRTTLRVERYVKKYDATKPYSQIPWKLRNVWASNLTKTTAERVEENIRYVKLIFPVSTSQLWNGNAQNVLAPWDYSYDRHSISAQWDTRLSSSNMDKHTYYAAYHCRIPIFINIEFIWK